MDGKFKDRMYYVIGDSHIISFSMQAEILPVNAIVNNDQFNCFHVGPILAYNTSGKTDIINNCNTVSADDSIIFCFGEIDMRNIHKRITAGTSDYKVRINEVVDNYFKCIDAVSNEHKIVFGVVPCLREEPFYNWFQNNPNDKDQFYAPAGDLSTRNLYKKYYNSQLKINCENRNIKYFDVFDEVFGKEELYMDDIHLSSPKVIDIITEKLKII